MAREHAGRSTGSHLKAFQNANARSASLLLQRKTYKMIAGELFISENTVKYYVKNIYSKLGYPEPRRAYRYGICDCRHNTQEIAKQRESQRFRAPPPEKGGGAFSC